MLHFFNKNNAIIASSSLQKLTGGLLISALWVGACLPASIAALPPQTTVAMGSGNALLVANSIPAASAAQAAAFQTAYRQAVVACP